MISDARQSFDQDGSPAIAIRFNEEGARRLARVTTENVGEPLALLLDDVVLFAPVIEQPITGGELLMRGNLSLEDVDQLALVIGSGALPIRLVVVQEKGFNGAHRD